MPLKRLGLGGGCHWCTEAVFQSLIGVEDVKQGWISAPPPDDTLSEAVELLFDDQVISMKDLISIHLLTHSCTSEHSLRSKYRSAVYCYCAGDAEAACDIIIELQKDFSRPIITKILKAQRFLLNQEKYLNYFKNHSESAFCKTYISPKLTIIMDRFSRFSRI